MSTLFVNTISPNSGDTVTISGSLNTTGKFTVGDAVTDNIVFNSEVSSSIVPDADSTYNLGSITQKWNTAHVDIFSGSLLQADTASVTYLNLTGPTAMHNARISGSLIPDESGYALGTMTDSWGSLHVHGLAHIHTASISQNVEIDGNLFVTSSGGFISASTLVVSQTSSIQNGIFNSLSSDLSPATNNVHNLGSLSLRWKHAFLNSASIADTLTVDNTISSSIVNAGSGSFTAIRSTTGTDTITISGSLIPDAGATYALGTMANSWASTHIHGLAHLHTASIGEVTSSLIPSVNNAVDLGSDGVRWKDLYLLGSASVGYLNLADARISGSLIPDADNSSDLGGVGLEFKDLYIDGTAYIDTIDSPLINVPTIEGPTIIGTGSIDAKHITASNLLVSGTCNFKSSVLASVDAAHLGSADGFSKFSVQGQLQAALADGATSAEFTVGNTNIDLGDVIFGTVHGALMGGLSQSNMIITTRTANSMSFVFNNESGLVAVDDSAFTASFAIIK